VSVRKNTIIERRQWHEKDRSITIKRDAYLPRLSSYPTFPLLSSATIV
jgi:hypothetical protein